LIGVVVFKVFSPRDLATKLEPFKFKSDSAAVALMDGLSNLTGVIEVNVGVNDTGNLEIDFHNVFDVIKFANANINSESWVLIRGNEIVAPDDVDKNHCHDRELDMLDLLCIDWDSKTLYSDLCSDEACCGPNNKLTFISDDEAAGLVSV
jgi:hypothetical protein